MAVIILAYIALSSGNFRRIFFPNKIMDDEIVEIKKKHLSYSSKFIYIKKLT